MTLDESMNGITINSTPPGAYFSAPRAGALRLSEPL
jgi:hypothetical protein